MSEVKLCTPLSVDQIDFRVQSINKGGYATILAYKDARVDMQRLDDAYGVDGWQRKHEIIGGLLYCSVGVFSSKLNQWVWKEDVGTKSNTEAEKGQASDSFKRACFNFGIGRELYDYPQISIKLNSDEFEIANGKAKQTWGLKIKQWQWKVYFTDKKVSYLSARDQNGKQRFEFFSLSGLFETISTVITGIASGDMIKAAEAWSECSDGQKAAMWVSKAKGGPFDQATRKAIQSSEFRELTTEVGSNV